MGKKILSDENVDTKNRVLSPGALFLSYITDLVFAVFVFSVFLLVTWALHRWSDALGLTSSLFYVRIIELAIISFGTLLCVLFFLNGTVRFIKKLKPQQLQESIKQVAGEPLHLHLRNVPIRFIETVSKQPVGYVICSMIVFALLYGGISFAEIVQDDSDDVSILACEMICETGPDFLKPVISDGDGIILEMLASYSKYLKHENLPDILRAFTDSLVRGLAVASQIVGDINIEGSQEEAANNIWRAGEEIMLSRLKAPKFLPRGIRLHEYREVSEELLTDIRKAVEDSRKAAKLFDEKPSMETAVESCERNRKTMLLLFLARASYNKPEVASLFASFREIVEECRNIKIEVAKRIQEKDDPRKEFLTIIAQSEQRRLDILDAIEKRDMQAAIERMWDAIEIAYSRKAGLLELCAKIRSAGNYSEKITP